MNDNVDYRYKSSQSFSHMVGCITALLIDFIKTPFTDDFFKTIRVTTEVPYNERRNFLRNTAMKPRPMMIIEPRFDPSDDAKFQPNSEFDYLVANDYSSGIQNDLNVGSPLIIDKDNKYLLCGSGARYKISFNITFIFETEIQKMQAQEHIRRSIRHQSYIVLERFIEQNIPQNFMEAISNIEGIDINSDDFIKLMNTYGEMPITHRVRPGSQNKEFFIMTPRSLQILFTSPPNSGDVEKKGKMVYSSTFTETVEIEFAAKSSYFLRCNKDMSKELDMSQSAVLSETVIKPIVTIPVGIMVNPLPETEDEYVKKYQLNTQFDNKEEDVLDITPYIKDNEITRVYDYHKQHGIPINFLRVKINENDTRLDYSRYTFNPEELTITLKKPDAYKHYLIGIYADFSYINKLKTSIISYDDFNDIKKNQ